MNARNGVAKQSGVQKGSRSIQSITRKDRSMHRFNNSIVVAFATLFVSICSAQQTATTAVPNLIRYSGTLKDAQGVPLSSSTAVGVTFSIYKQQDGGAAVWMESQNVTPDAVSYTHLRAHETRHDLVC